MTRLSAFREDFTVSFRPSWDINERVGQPAPQASETESTESESTKSESIKSKSESESEPSPLKTLAKNFKWISAPLKRLAGYYKAHINELLSNNSSSSSVRAGKQRVVEASSTSYGVPQATEEELNRQAERNYLDYVFYLNDSEGSITHWSEGNTLPHPNTLDSSLPLFEESTESEEFDLSSLESTNLSAHPDPHKWYHADAFGSSSGSSTDTFGQFTSEDINGEKWLLGLQNEDDNEPIIPGGQRMVFRIANENYNAEPINGGERWLLRVRRR